MWKGIMPTQIKKQKGLYTFLIIAFVVWLFFTAYFVWFYIESVAYNPVVKLTMVKADEPEKLPMKVEEDEIAFSTMLKGELADMRLMIRSEYQWLDVYIDERLIFSSPRDCGSKDPGRGAYFVSLSQEDTGKELLIVVKDFAPMYQTNLKNVYAGTEDSLRTFASLSSLPYFIIMCICVVGGIVLAIVVLLSTFSSDLHLSNFFLGIFSIGWGLYSIFDTLLIYDMLNPAALSYVSVVLYCFNPLPLSLFLYFRLEHFRKYGTPLIALLIICSVAVLFAPMTSLTFATITEYSIPVYQVAFVYSAILFAGDIVKGNVFIKKIVPYILPLIIIVAIKSINYYINIAPSYIVSHLTYVCYLILIIGIWSLSGFDFYQTWLRINKKMDAVELRNNMITASYRELLKKDEDLFAIKHEMKHMITAAQWLLSQANASEAEQFLEALTNRAAFQTQNFCDNQLINTIVTDGYSRAKENSVCFEQELEVPQDIKLDTNMLCSIIMNLLDNALEASVLLPESQRLIKLTMRMKKKYLFIKCENAANITAAMSKGDFSTTKKDGRKHGMGLNIVRGLVEKNSGLLEIKAEDGRFIVKVALLLEEVKS